MERVDGGALTRTLASRGDGTAVTVLVLAAVLCMAAADDDGSSRHGSPALVAAAGSVHAPAASYTARPQARWWLTHSHATPDRRYGPPSHVQRGYASEYQQPRYYQPRPYSFAYGVNDQYGSGTVFSRSEESDGATTRGRYSVQLPDGCTQTVTFWADHTGYHPTVKYDCVQKRRPAPSAPYRYGTSAYKTADVTQYYRRPYSHYDD